MIAHFATRQYVKLVKMRLDFLGGCDYHLDKSSHNQKEVPMPANIILDTDMDTDCDDAAAMAVLHALADRGEARILATVVSSLYPWSAPTVAAVNAYYGRADVPLGVPKGTGASIDRGSRYAQQIATEFPTACHHNDDAPDAVTVYRQVLAAAADHSVTIVTIGYLTNLSNLLRSEADSISPLNGTKLVQRKVQHYVCMGSRYPRDDDPRPWGNFKPDPAAVVHVAAAWPTVITFTGGGEFADSLATGRRLYSETPGRNPVRRVYELYFSGRAEPRHSADQIAVLVGVRGTGRPWHLETAGHNHIFPNGTHEWRTTPNNPRHQYIAALATGVNPTELAQEIEDLMVQTPD